MSFDFNQDAPEYTLISQRMVKARKNHVCAVCNEIMPAGTMQAVHVYVEDGKFYSERGHGFDYPSCPRDIAAEQRFLAEDPAKQQRILSLSPREDGR